MKTRRTAWGGAEVRAAGKANRKRQEGMRQLVNQSRKAVSSEHASHFGSDSQWLRLALNEAEALAWQTDYPHLVFPGLAEEKTAAALAWKRRQFHLKEVGSELAFAS